MPGGGSAAAAGAEGAVNPRNFGGAMDPSGNHQIEADEGAGVTLRNRSVTLSNSTGGPVAQPGGGRGNDWIVALFVVALGVLLTPAVQLWAAPGVSWLMPYAVWGMLILLTYALQRRDSNGD